MYLPGKIMKAGKSANPDLTQLAAVATTYTLDMTQGSPAWKQTSSLHFARAFLNLTVLPDGNVLATGGGASTNATDLPNAVLPSELWSPSSGTWQTLSSMHGPRLYHSSAILLPDARVLVLGSGGFFGTRDVSDQLSAEIFAPPYLFKGPRPTITSAPAQLSYGANFTIQTPDASRIASVSLIALSSPTHAFNMNQRFIPLTFTAGTNSLSATAPANANIAPGGYYLLFIVSTDGVPSVAATIKF